MEPASSPILGRSIASGVLLTPLLILMARASLFVRAAFSRPEKYSVLPGHTGGRARTPHSTPGPRPGLRPGRMAALTLAIAVLAAPASPGTGHAAGNLSVNGDVRITSDATYNDIRGDSGSLTVRDARLQANSINAASVRFFSDTATVTTAGDFRIGPLYLRNSLIRVGGIFQTPSRGDIVMTNSSVVADLVSIGWDYVNPDDGSVTPPGHPGDDPADGVPPSQHSDSTITARSDVIFYGGLDALAGESVITSLEGTIQANGSQGLQARAGAILRLYAPNGSIIAPNITATTALAKRIYALNVTMRDGSFILTDPTIDTSNRTNYIRETLTLLNTRASIAALHVDNKVSVSGGSLTAGRLELPGGVSFSNGARAGIENLSIHNDTLLAVNSRVAVENLTNSTGGTVIVGHNAALGLGTADPDWIVRQFDAAEGSTLAPVTAALAVVTPQTLSALPGIVVDGARTDSAAGATSRTAVFAPHSLLVVSANAASATGPGALSGGDFEVQAGARLYIPDAVPGGTYHVLEPLDPASTYGGDDAWNGANLASGTPLLELVRLPDFGWFGTRTVSAESTFTKLHPSLVDMLDKTYAAGLIGPDHVDSAVPGIRFLSRAISREYIANNGRLAASTIESAARMAVLGAVPQMTMTANSAGSMAMNRRTGAEPGAGIRAVGGDGAPIDEDDALHRHGWALWIMPVFQSAHGFGLTAGNYALDYSGNLGGIALGCDYTFASALRLGLSLNAGGGYARGSGELAGTTNSMGFWGAGLYGGWRRGAFGLSADAAFTATSNSLRQGLPARMEMRPLKSDINAWAFSGGMRAEYRLGTPWLDVTPHAGARWLYLYTGDWDARSSGTVVHGDATRQNIWTFPVGVSLSRAFALSDGWRFSPVLDLSVIPAAGDLDAKAKVRFTGTGMDADLETQIMDHISYRGVLGVEFAGNDLAFALDGSVQAGMKTTTWGIAASMSYEF